MLESKLSQLPTHIARLSGREARERLHHLYGVLRNPNLSPRLKVVALITLDEHERQGLKPGEWMTIDEEELARLAGLAVDEGDD